MRKVFVFIFLISTTSLISQEIGHIKNGKYSLTLIQNDQYFELVYSDLNSKTEHIQKSFKFLNKEKLYGILMEGFLKKNDHQVMVWSNKDTVVKFNFKTIRGEVLVYLNHNNFKKKVRGISTTFSKKQIVELFGNP